MRILLIEDDLKVQTYIEKGFREAGHFIKVANDGEKGLFFAQSETYDCLIVDRMLPKIDGLSLIKTLRASGNLVSVLILSALGDVDDRVMGLRSGGDDYLIKPFAFEELLARVEVLGKRNKQQVTHLKVHDLEMDLLSRKVTKAGIIVDLQTREFRLLEFLLTHKNQLVTRTMLLEAVWNYHFDPQTGVIDVHISRLRKKIGDNNSKIIKTVRGAGYIIQENS